MDGHAWVKGALILFVLLEIAEYIFSIDQERSRITKGAAVMKLIGNGAWIYLIIKFL